MLRKRIQLADDGYAGKYRICSDYLCFRTSSDYGETWNRIDSSMCSDPYDADAALSATGQYQIITAGHAGFYCSSDYGKTWAIVSTHYLTSRGVFISADGKYQFVTDGGYTYESSDYGNTWTEEGYLPIHSISFSESGRYRLKRNSNPVPYVSSDYGVTWTPIVELPIYSPWFTVCVSDSGKYMACMNEREYMYKSSDFGKTWDAEQVAYSRYGVLFSTTGKYQVIGNNNGSGTTGDSSAGAVVYESSDYGNTWIETVFPELIIRSISLSLTGRRQMIYGVLNELPILHTSFDYGKTWTLGNGIAHGISDRAGMYFNGFKSKRA